jgi:transcriptional regulator with XRE-family HTH domain
MFYMTERDLRAILGENIKRYRTLKGLSQAKLSEILEISPNFISDIETGKRWLSSDTLVKLAGALGFEVYEFLKSPETSTEEMSAFIQNYTEKAEKTASEAVARSLSDLRKLYVDKA